MTGQDECLRELRALVTKADRDDLAVAQELLLRFAFHGDDTVSRKAAFDALIAELTRDDVTGFRTREQHAFHVALLAMVERTQDMALSHESEMPASARVSQS